MIAAVLAAIWVLPLLHYRKLKEETRKKKEKEIRTSLLGQAALTAILLFLAGISCWGFADTSRNIQLDIREQSYTAYSGEVTLESDLPTKGRFYDRLQSVWLEDGTVVYQYIDSLREALTRDAGTYEAELVYGAHSGYVVYIELSE